MILNPEQERKHANVCEKLPRVTRGNKKLRNSRCLQIAEIRHFELQGQ